MTPTMVAIIVMQIATVEELATATKRTIVAKRARGMLVSARFSELPIKSPLLCLMSLWTALRVFQVTTVKRQIVRIFSSSFLTVFILSLYLRVFQDVDVFLELVCFDDDWFAVDPAVGVPAAAGIVLGGGAALQERLAVRDVFVFARVVSAGGGV